MKSSFGISSNICNYEQTKPFWFQLIRLVPTFQVVRILPVQAGRHSRLAMQPLVNLETI